MRERERADAITGGGGLADPRRFARAKHADAIFLTIPMLLTNDHLLLDSLGLFGLFLRVSHRCVLVLIHAATVLGGVVLPMMFKPV